MRIKRELKTMLDAAVPYAGMEIDPVWAAGKLTSATIRSVKGTTCEVRNGMTRIDLTLKAGKTVAQYANLKPKTVSHEPSVLPESMKMGARWGF
jgi:hypothetical protein